MHIYKNSKGNWLPSVTEIIQKTRPVEQIVKLEKAIENKKIREGKSDADWEAHMKNAQDRGTKTHLYMETYLPLIEAGNKEILERGGCSEPTFKKIFECRQKAEADYESGDYCNSISKYLYELNRKTRKWKLLTTEAEVINEEYQYGGRTDSLINLDGKNLLLDLKTNGGYWNSYQQRQIYKWQEWSKSFNGIFIETDHTSHWDMVDDKLKDKFIQLALYIMAMRDMKSRGCFKWEIEDAAILVAFPNEYQYIEMKHEVWAGCFAEAEERAVRYRKNHLDEWEQRAKQFASENPDIQI